MQNETQLPKSELRNQNLLLAYQNPDNVTLYRYDNPAEPYDETREGIVSKKKLVGSWFTNNIDDFKTYIKQRKPGGKVVIIRIPKEQLERYDAAKLEQTKDMDIEKDNFIIPEEVQAASRIGIPLEVKTANAEKFLLADWQQVNDFVDNRLALDKLVEYIKSNE